MNQRIRKPALAPPPVRIAPPRDENPAAFLGAHYERVWQQRMADMPFVNPALQVAATGFVRCRGDWLGVVVTPWFINLFLLAGGGELWDDIAAGERRYVDLPCGALQFIADDDPDLGLYQYCPLIAPVMSIADMGVARQAAADAMAAVLTPAVADDAADATAEAEPSSAPEAPPRRGFLRQLAGRH
ncbi:MAG: [NiFe]-hydrogenase assembly chaperone HybE [Bacteroidota bacterium]